ncbi:CLUMA_CG009848, isoform A [Clunio marinus]|uniref:CLUMA_CG009848, isoform A n=1 Tax=Clunio marinus TaxID=568069 RepID=A0A1J1I839_9DIPT|nr:CLUMA_CG009848, isoform A [Clunio marinus]
MSALNVKTLTYEEKELFVPEMETLCSVIETGLKSNFSDVSVSVVDCPNLSQAPFHLASSGLGGDATLVEFGSPVYLLPLVNKSKIYDIVELLRNISSYESKEFFTCGAGAGPFPIFNQNCEGMLNIRVGSDGTLKNETHVARIVPGGVELSKVPDQETRCALLGNLYLSEGKAGKVLKVTAKRRTGSENFISSMRLALAEYFTDDKTVGLGGTFLIKEGKAKQHVMDEFSKVPLYTEDDVNKWLTFHEMSAPLIAVGTFVTNEADLDLRLQHFHSFSKHGEGGHYHYDVTPDTVEYEGYFAVGRRIIRIDKPEQKLKQDSSGDLDPINLKYQEKETHKPSLDEIRNVLEEALKKNFNEVSVEIVDNPDLKSEPFYLASSGISGNPLIIEYGNDDYLLPLVDKSKVYNLIPTIREIETYKEKNFYVCGAGAGPFPLYDQNCEGIYNMKVFKNGTIDNQSHIARTQGSGTETLKLPNNETRAALLGNLFLSEGNDGKVLKVIAKNRTGEENFISAMRLGLSEKYSEDEVVGLGGVFVMKKGIANIHVMDRFSENPINTDEELNNWLTFHEMPAPLIALGNFVSHQTDFKLRYHHFHCFSKHNHGGHYHYDVTPDIVEYEGYFNIAERIILIDKSFAASSSPQLLVIILSAFIVKLINYLL